MENTFEYVVPLIVAAGASNNQANFTPQQGEIVGCSIYHDNAGNAGIVNAAILDSNNAEISRMQHIDNYRNREAEYSKGYKPLNVSASGQTMTFQIQATQALTNAVTAQLILHYKLPASCLQ